jgi:hypothetical protein
MGRLKETKRRLRFSVVEVVNAENRKRLKPESTGKNQAKVPTRGWLQCTTVFISNGLLHQSFQFIENEVFVKDNRT